MTIKKHFWKIAFFLTLTLLIVTLTCSFYLVVDQGVTITHIQESYEQTESDLQTTVAIINNSSRTKEEIKSLLENHRLIEFLNFNRDDVRLERIELHFEDDILDKITITP